MLTDYGSTYALRLDLELSYWADSTHLDYLGLHSYVIACA